MPRTVRLTSVLAALLPLSAQQIATGPALGDHIPEFTATDQTRRARNFENLRGPHGLALLFVRSADW